ncbi:unnamed protein product [Urochloa humidicola]
MHCKNFGLLASRGISHEKVRDTERELRGQGVRGPAQGADPGHADRLLQDKMRSTAGTSGNGDSRQRVHPTQAGWEAVMEQLEQDIKDFIHISY